MTFGRKYSLFFKDCKVVEYKDMLNNEKIELLKDYSVGEALTLLRNIEESPNEFDEEIIKAIYTVLYDKGIMCI